MITGHGDDAYQYEDIRMDFSSNIFGHADLSDLKEHLRQHLDLIDHYPEPEAVTLEREIAARRGVPPACVMVTNGATDAIYLIAQSLSLSFRHEPMSLPSQGEGKQTEAHGRFRFEVRQPTFSEYEDACRMYGVHSGLGMMEEKQGSDARLHTALWLCNPNNPTGEVLPREEVLRLASSYGLLILDQSYEDYTDAPLLTPVEVIRNRRIIQIFSMTKANAVPGLRIGYVIAPAEMISHLRTFLRPWSVNALAIEAGLWLIRHDAKAIPDKTSYLAEAQRLRHELAALPGIEVHPTATNFMLCRIAGHTAAELKCHLAEECHILIRDASNFAGLDDHYFRIAAQTQKEDDALIRAIHRFISIC